jgi:hypothetical protein
LQAVEKARAVDGDLLDLSALRGGERLYGMDALSERRKPLGTQWLKLLAWSGTPTARGDLLQRDARNQRLEGRPSQSERPRQRLDARVHQGQD